MSTFFWCASVTLAIEIITILGRIKYGPRNIMHKKSGSKIRIHHGYYGIALLLIYWVNPLLIEQESIILILGSALFFSDLIHHFVVLPIWVKRTEFPN